MARVLTMLIMSSASLIAFSEASWAGLRGAPAPVAGVGLPALAIGAGCYWLFRKIRDRGTH